MSKIFLEKNKNFTFQATFSFQITYSHSKQPIRLNTIGDIINGCADNNHKYQKILYERYYGYALKTVFRYIFKYEKAVDVVNDGFVKLFRHFGQFKADDPANIEPMLMGWIRCIMVNNAIDELRKKDMQPDAGFVSEEVWEQTEHSDNADQLLLYKDLMIQVRKLPPMYRAVFNMYVIDGFNHNEIAEKLGIAAGTSKSNLWKARSLLQAYLKEQPNNNELCKM